MWFPHVVGLIMLNSPTVIRLKPQHVCRVRVHLMLRDELDILQLLCRGMEKSVEREEYNMQRNRRSPCYSQCLHHDQQGSKRQPQLSFLCFLPFTTRTYLRVLFKGPTSIFAFFVSNLPVASSSRFRPEWPTDHHDDSPW